MAETDDETVLRRLIDDLKDREELIPLRNKVKFTLFCVEKVSTKILKYFDVLNFLL